MNQWTSCFLWALMFLSQVQLVAPMPGIEKFLFLADSVANITTYATEIGLEGEAPEVKVLDQTQIEPRVIDSNPILTFLDICNNGIGRNLPFSIECYCSVGIFPPNFGGACESTRMRCLGGMITGQNLLCGYPEVGFHFDALSILEQWFPLEMYACFHESYLFGLRVPSLVPTCFNFIGPRVFDMLGILPIEEESVGSDSLEPPASRCTITHGNEVCESCTPCVNENGQIGMRFDCESIQASLKSNDDCVTLGDVLFS